MALCRFDPFPDVALAWQIAGTGRRACGGAAEHEGAKPSRTETITEAARLGTLLRSKSSRAVLKETEYRLASLEGRCLAGARRVEERERSRGTLFIHSQQPTRLFDLQQSGRMLVVTDKLSGRNRPAPYCRHLIHYGRSSPIRIAGRRNRSVVLYAYPPSRNTGPPARADHEETD